MKIKAGLVVVLVLIALLPAASAQGEVVDHKVCGEISNNQPEDIKDTFYTDDVVHSWVEVSGGEEDSTLKWVFEGPRGVRNTTTKPLEKDVSRYHSSLNLNDYSKQDVVGNWTIKCYLDGEQAFKESFKVEPITGGLWWWGPFLGLLILIIAVLIIIALIIGVAYLLLKLIRSGR